MQICVYLVSLALEARLRKWKGFILIVAMVPGVPSGDHGNWG